MKADAFAYDVHAEATRTRDLARNDPEDKRSFYEHYIGAMRTKMSEKKQKAEQQAQETSKRDTKVNLAVTQYESLFKDIKLPGGISTKATEYKDLASTGERWESPIFTIDDACESTGLPRLEPIRRKPHGITVKGDEGKRAAEPVTAPTHTKTAMPRAAEPKARGAKAMMDGPRTIPGTSCPV